MPPADESVLNLAALRPKSFLRLRLMFDGFWKVLTIIGLVFALTGAASGGLAAYFVHLEQRYRREGRTTTASGTRRRTTRHYRVSYTFTAPDGSTHAGRGNTPYSRWKSLKPGDRIKVQYLASEPSKNRLFGEGGNAARWLIVLFPIAFGCGGAVMLAIAARAAGRTAHLLANGVLTRGVVEEKAERKSITINGRHPYDITFTFSLADGTVHTGKALVTDIALAERLEPGTTIGAIYLPTNPDRCAVFNEKWRKYFR